MTVRERDPKTGRPVEDGRELPPSALSDLELDEELLVAAAAAGRYRLDRFESLVAELARRRPTHSTS
jgi:hypothetical protein